MIREEFNVTVFLYKLWTERGSFLFPRERILGKMKARFALNLAAGIVLVHTL